MTQANVQGISTNDSATVTTGFGHDTVTLNRNCSVAVTNDGTALALSKG